MKRTLICFFSSFLAIVAIAQNDTQTPNSPGEDVSVSADGNAYADITMDDYKALESKIEKRAKTVEKKYFIESETFNSYNSTYSTTKSAVKSKIYKAGQILIEDQQTKLTNTPNSDFKSRYANLKQIDRIYDRLTFFSKQVNTRPIEKQLKKLKNPAEISPLFFGEE